MSESMQNEIDDLVNQLSPPQGAVGLMTSKDVRDLVRKAATQGTLIGYVVGEKLTRLHGVHKINELKYDYDQLKSHCKDLEMEIMALKR